MALSKNKISKIPLKQCSKCSKKKAASVENFPADPKGLFGLRGDCRACRRKADAASARRRRGGSPEVPAAKVETLSEEESFVAAAERIMGRNPIKSTGSTGKSFATEVKQKDGSVKVVLILSDVHVPEHDRRVWSAVMQWIRDHQPDEIILNGDFLELVSCSQHGGSADITPLERDFEAGRAAIAELRDVAPDATITYLEGNHETRLPRFILAKAPALFGSLTISTGLHLDKYGVNYVEEAAQPVQRGTLDILHGHQLGAGKHGGLPRHHAAKAVDVYGRPARTVIFGHSHRSQAFSKASYGGNSYSVALGAMRTLNPRWLQGHLAGWTHQFGVAYVRETGPSDVYAVTLHNGSFVWNGKLYVGTT
jgi:predicted phosphodiesterase